MLELNKIYCINNIQGMIQLGANKIDLTVTSPPYDNLRNYNGYSFDFERTARGLYYVTKPGGVIIWVVGDATIKGSETGTSFKQALYFKEIGFNLHDTMIYQKINAMPNKNAKRYRQSFEYIFVFSKGCPKTFNPIEVKIKNFTIGTQRNKNGILSTERKINKNECRKIDNIFSYGVGSNKTNHPAVFPELLVQDQILSWSNENDIVLDPFMGSGTTAKMALLNNRNYIGFEISEEYCQIAEQRLCAIDKM